MNRKLKSLSFFLVIGITGVICFSHFSPMSGSAQLAPTQMPESLKAAVLECRWQEVDTEALQWARRSGATRTTSVLRGYAALMIGRSDDAAEYFVRADHSTLPPAARGWAADLAAEFPESAVAQMFAGDEAARGGELTAGLIHLNKSVALDQGLDIARLVRAILRLKLGDCRGAKEDLASIPSDCPAAKDSLVIGAILDLQRNDNLQAAADMDRLLESSPDNALAHNVRGVAFARIKDWPRAADDFASAFHILPDLTEARRNWQLAEVASNDPGTVIASQLHRGSIMIVSADDAKDLSTATALASDELRLRTGRAPLVIHNLTDAIDKARSQHVIFPLSTNGLSSALGDRTLETLKAIDGRVPVNILANGNEAAYATGWGALRYSNTASKDRLSQLKSIQAFDPSDVSGVVGKTPLAGAQDLGDIAKRFAQLVSRGVTVTVFPVEGKFGIQHIGNLNEFTKYQELKVVSTPWKGSFQMSVGLPSPGISVDNANDRAAASNVPRDWTVHRGSIEQHFTGNAAEIGKGYLNLGDSLVTSTPIHSQQYTRGGVTLEAVNVSRASGGQIIFNSGVKGSKSLALIYPIFCVTPHGD